MSVERPLFVMPVRVAEHPDLVGPIAQPLLWEPADEIVYEGDET